MFPLQRGPLVTNRSSGGHQTYTVFQETQGVQKLVISGCSCTFLGSQSPCHATPAPGLTMPLRTVGLSGVRALRRSQGRPGTAPRPLSLKEEKAGETRAVRASAQAKALSLQQLLKK